MNIVAGIAIAAILLVASYSLSRDLQPQELVKETEQFEPYRASLSGKQVCLPPLDTTGEITLECAIGIETEEGEYYSLDLNLLSDMHPELQNGELFSASGLVTPIENLSSDHLRKYNVKGIFSVTDSLVVEESEGVVEIDPLPMPPTKESATGPCYVSGCSSQICSGQSDVVSDCMYREEYACYPTATCERQVETGLCGWTETPELKACLSAASPE